MSKPNPLRLDGVASTTKYIALCKMMEDLTGRSIEEIDAEVEMFILEVQSEILDRLEGEVHLNG